MDGGEPSCDEMKETAAFIVKRTTDNTTSSEDGVDV